MSLLGIKVGGVEVGGTKRGSSLQLRWHTGPVNAKMSWEVAFW